MNNNNSVKDDIVKLKKEKNAVILAHYYQKLEVQEIADFIGDSFELSKKAKTVENQIVVFCGVRFMAESAKILSPNKTVLLPAKNAGCPMADMVCPEDVLKLKALYPDAAVVCYVNSSAETKAVSDICCTSSNAVKIVRSLPNKQIIFIPDKNLGAYVASFVPEKKFIFHDGYCPIHKNITQDEVTQAKIAHPTALFAVHPECEANVIDKADFIGSTSEIIKFTEQSDNKDFIIGTEVGVVEKLSKDNPNKKFYLLSPYLICPNMKKTELTDVLKVLQDGSNEIIMTDEQIKNAYAPLNKMVNI